MFQADRGEVSDTAGVGFISVTEQAYVGDGDTSFLFPDFAVNGQQIDFFILSAAHVFIATIGHIMRKATNVLVLASAQAVAPDYLHGAALARCGAKADE